MTHKQHIMALCGIDQDQYSQIVFDTGIAYAEKYTYGNKEMYRRLTATKMYWEWWKNACDSIDGRFLASYRGLSSLDSRTLLNFYKVEHDPYRLQMTPNHLVLKELIKQA